MYHHHLKRLSWFHYWEKSTLNPEVMKKYRPVSNLPFVSKVLERAVLRRLLNHLDVTNQHEPHQPVYRLLHSTETALVRVCNDILLSLDSRKAVSLVLLDLSVAFDTIDYEMLLDRLSDIRVQGMAHKWFQSYLQILINQSSSREPNQKVCL